MQAEKVDDNKSLCKGSFYQFLKLKHKYKSINIGFLFCFPKNELGSPPHLLISAAYFLSHKVKKYTLKRIGRHIDYAFFCYNVLFLLKFGRFAIAKKHFERKMNNRNNFKRQFATTK